MDAGMDERVTVAEAAERLAISKEAVRKRIYRGTLHSDRDEDGTVRVYIPTSSTPFGTQQDTPHEMVGELRDRVRFLERELERRGNEADRYQRIVAGLAQANANLTEQVREIEAPQRAEGGAHGPSEAEEGGPRPEWWRA
jgi:hypothetical protein